MFANPSAEEPLQLELPVRSDSVAAARHRAGEFAERIGVDPADVELAVSEAVSNSVVHAYPEGSEGTITVRVEVDESDLLITVADDGTGLRPSLESEGIGFGLPTIARLTDVCRIEDARQGGAVMTMRFGTRRA